MDDLQKARDILQSAIARRPSDHRLNFQFAELLRQTGDTDFGQLAYYYRRAYTPGDIHYQAQFWNARYLYESTDTSDIHKAIDIFNSLRNARISFDSRIKIRDYIGGKDNPTYKEGRIARKREAYGFITLDGTGQDIFCPRKEVEEKNWDLLLEGDRVKCKIGFSFNGPVCCDVKVT